MYLFCLEKININNHLKNIEQFPSKSQFKDQNINLKDLKVSKNG